MSDNAGIYAITSPSNKVYIGQSHNIKKRYKQYAYLSNKEQPAIHNSILKYGWETHKFETILYLDERINQSLYDYWECFFIEHYKQQGYTLLNLTSGGGHCKMSEEAKIKMSIAAKGKVKSAEWRKKISDSNKLTRKLGLHKPSIYWLGKERSQETKNKISKSSIGKQLSEEHKAKVGRQGEKHHKSKLSNEQVRIIMHALKFGAIGTELAKIFNIGSTTVYEIGNGIHWSHVTGIPKRKNYQ